MPMSIRVPIGRAALVGDLTIPARAETLVVFAHGSGSSRHSRRNQFVARSLERRDLGTLLIDLLTVEEEARDQSTAQLRFDIPLLAARLVAIMDWLAGQPEAARLTIGLFGASTGGGAALVAAAEKPSRVGAVVSRGGRPDLAGSALARVRAPTLLIVGSEDRDVLSLNREAMTRMTAAVSLALVEGATHLFEEPGALVQVATLAGDWFTTRAAVPPLDPAPSENLQSR
jgi:pimeloyl-ACP methyl ester carboxylesterase